MNSSLKRNKSIIDKAQDAKIIGALPRGPMDRRRTVSPERSVMHGETFGKLRERSDESPEEAFKRLHP